MRKAEAYRAGRRPVPGAPFTGDARTDEAIRYVLAAVNGLQSEVGIYMTPEHDLEAVVGAVAEGETILLLPGTYYFSGQPTIDKRCTLVGAGRAIIKFHDDWLEVSASDVVLRNLEFQRQDTRANSSSRFVRLTGDRCRVDGCLFDSGASQTVRVDGDYCAVTDCKFLPNSERAAGDADVYYADGATYGIVAGNQWSTTAATYVLDYKTATNMSEAANGPAAIINVRP